jgi:hypothetical protein
MVAAVSMVAVAFTAEAAVTAKKYPAQLIGNPNVKPWAMTSRLGLFQFILPMLLEAMFC